MCAQSKLSGGISCSWDTHIIKTAGYYIDLQVIISPKPLSMSESFIVFQQFNDLELAKETAGILAKQGIENVIEGGAVFVDSNIVGVVAPQVVSIKLLPGDFSRANQVLDDYYQQQLDQVDKDYYLLQFTNAELMEVVAKRDEWGHFDYQLARKLLKDRGQEVAQPTDEKLTNQRLNELAKPDKIHPAWIFVGYASAILGGLAGIVIGTTLLYSKKTLPDGQRTLAYNHNVRTHAKAITIISFTVLAIAFMLRVFLETE
jgi:hypothetical protein